MPTTVVADTLPTPLPRPPAGPVDPNGKRPCPHYGGQIGNGFRTCPHCDRAVPYLAAKG